jgi:hypothetical protein
MSIKGTADGNGPKGNTCAYKNQILSTTHRIDEWSAARAVSQWV